MATHSSVLAWRVPWTEEPGALQSKGSHRVGHDLRDLALMHTIFKGYFPFIVITKYWLHSPYCTIHPWACATPNSLRLPFPHPYIISPPFPLLTTNLHSISMSLLLFYYIHCVVFFRFGTQVQNITQYLSLSDFIHLALCSPGPSVLLQMAKFHSF